MNSIMATAASGMDASATWMSVIASDIANARDISAISATSPSQPAIPAANTQPAAFQPVTVSLSAQAAGGVQAQVTPTLPATIAAYDPSSTYANAQGLVGMPNVDLVTQFVDLASAKASYQANAAIFKAADETTRATLNLVA
ncbi:MAG: flagellar basal body rod protein FlgC [Rhizomicrobium sp.]